MNGLQEKSFAISMDGNVHNFTLTSQELLETFLPLTHWILELVRKLPSSERLLVGVVGYPGAGKVGIRLAKLINTDSVC